MSRRGKKDADNGKSAKSNKSTSKEATSTATKDDLILKELKSMRNEINADSFPIDYKSLLLKFFSILV